MKMVGTAARAVGVVVLTAVISAVCSQARTATAAIDPELLAMRELAWRSYFGGDVKTLGDMLPPEFIGIGMTDAPFGDRATTLEAAKTFHEGGGRLIRLAFPETREQRFGDAVVLYGRYEAEIESGGQQRTMRGRLTEMFVRRDGKWLHPGWHLDLTAAPPAAQ